MLMVMTRGIHLGITCKEMLLKTMELEENQQRGEYRERRLD